jgi:DNA-directed RNA polymerase specialized sigma24 family protein
LRARAFEALPWVQAQLAARRPHRVRRSRDDAPPPIEALAVVEEALILDDPEAAGSELLRLLGGRANATEVAIVRLRLGGLSYSQVAAKLGVAKGTVSRHMTRLAGRRLPGRARALMKILL